MSDSATTDAARQLPGFFGAERARITEELAPEIWTEIDDFLADRNGGERAKGGSSPPTMR